MIFQDRFKYQFGIFLGCSRQIEDRKFPRYFLISRYTLFYVIKRIYSSKLLRTQERDIINIYRYVS